MPASVAAVMCVCDEVQRCQIFPSGFSSVSSIVRLALLCKLTQFSSLPVDLVRGRGIACRNERPWLGNK